MLSYHYPKSENPPGLHIYYSFGYIILYRKSKLTNILIHRVSQSGYGALCTNFSKSMIEVPYPKPKSRLVAFTKLPKSSQTTDSDIFNPLRLLDTLSKVMKIPEMSEAYNIDVFDIDSFEHKDFYNPNENFELYAKFLNKRFHPMKISSNKLVMGNRLYPFMEEDKP